MQQRRGLQGHLRPLFLFIIHQFSFREEITIKISGCIIAKDEEHNIARCMNSIIPLVDEVILVDTGSTDNTVAIAKKLGAKTFYFKWMNDFAAARNYALSKAKGEWILFPDADEYFAEYDPKKFRQILSQVNSAVDGLSIRAYDVTEDGNQVTRSRTNVRIIRNSQRIRYTGRIHERLVKSGGKIHFVDFSNHFTIFHVGYNPESRLKKDKTLRNVTLLQEELAENPKDGNLHFYISNEYRIQNNWDKTIEHGKAALKYGITLLGREVVAYDNVITAMMRRGAGRKEMFDLLRTALKKYPDYTELYVSQALYYRIRKLPIDEIHSLQNAIEVYGTSNPNYPSSYSPQLLKSLYERLMNLYYQLDDTQNVVIYCTKVLQVDKHDRNAFRKLVRTLMGNEKDDSIIEFLGKLYHSAEDIDFVVKNAIEINAAAVFNHYYSLLPEADQSPFKIYSDYFTKRYHEALQGALSKYQSDGNLYFGLIGLSCAKALADIDSIRMFEKSMPASEVTSLARFLLGDQLPESAGLLFSKVVEHAWDLDNSNLMSFLISRIETMPIPLKTIFAGVLYQRRKWQSAVEYYMQTVDDAAFGSPLMHMRAARCLDYLGQPEQSREVLFKSLKKHPGSFEPYFRLIKSETLPEGKETFLVLLNEARKRFPDSLWLEQEFGKEGTETEREDTAEQITTQNRAYGAKNEKDADDMNKTLREIGIQESKNELIESSKEPKKILYLGWLGKGNVGDELLFNIFKKMLYKNENHNVCVDSYTPINNYEIDLLQYNLIVLGGGSIFMLDGYESLCLRAIESNIPIFTWGTGIDIRDTKMIHQIINAYEDNKVIHLQRSKTSYIVNSAVYATVRGKLDKYILNNDKIQIIGDPGIIFDRLNNKYPKISELEEFEPTKQDLVLINWGTSYNNIAGNDEKNLENELKNATDYLLKKGYKILVYPIWTEDIKMCEKFIEHFNNPNIKCIKKVYDVYGLSSMISSCKFSINLKLHANILSMAMKKPFISLGYGLKCYDFADSVDSLDLLILTYEVNANKIIEKVNYVEENYINLRKRFTDYIHLYEKKQLDFMNKLISL